MSNMMLKIEADTGKLDAKLRQADENVRKLEASVKIGDRTMRANVTTQDQLTKALEKFGQASNNVSTAQQRRTNSLQAQERATAKLDASMRQSVISAGKMLGGLLGLGSAAGAIKVVTDELMRMDQALVDSAKSANTQMKGLREFVAQQDGSAEGQKFLGEVLIQGAQRGLTTDASAKMAGPIQSISDADGNGKLDAAERKNFDTDFGAAAGMSEAGVAAADALKIITAGRARGQSGAVSADLMSKAAQLSAINPSDVAKSISATSEFSDQSEALSVFNALAVEQTDTAKLPAAMERLGVILGKAGEVGETEKFSKKYGLAGLSETEKIAKLRAEGNRRGKGATEEERVRDWTATLPGEDGLAKETALDLARVVRQAPVMNKAKTALAAGSTGALDEILRKNEASPFAGPGIVQDRQAALKAVGELIGPQSEAAQRALAARQIEGAAAIKSGDVANLTPEGDMKPLGEQTWGAWLGKIGGAMGASASVGYGANPSMANIEAQQRKAAQAPTVDQAGVSAVQAELVAELKRLNENLAKNTDATQANSTASKSSKPVGGAASNAEEKY
jgi:hypothetical protein